MGTSRVVVGMLLVGTENDIPTNPDASLLMPKKSPNYYVDRPV